MGQGKFKDVQRRARAAREQEEREEVLYQQQEARRRDEERQRRREEEERLRLAREEQSRKDNLAIWTFLQSFESVDRFGKIKGFNLRGQFPQVEAPMRRAKDLLETHGYSYVHDGNDTLLYWYPKPETPKKKQDPRYKQTRNPTEAEEYEEYLAKVVNK